MKKIIVFVVWIVLLSMASLASVVSAEEGKGWNLTVAEKYANKNLYNVSLVADDMPGVISYAALTSPWGLTGYVWSFDSLSKPNLRNPGGETDIGVFQAFANVFGVAGLDADVGFEFQDYAQRLQWGQEDFIKPYADLSFLFWQRGKQKLSAFAHLESLIALDGGKAGICPHLGMEYRTQIWRLNLYLNIAGIYDDGTFTKEATTVGRYIGGVAYPVTKEFSLVCEFKATTPWQSSFRKDEYMLLFGFVYSHDFGGK